MSNTDVVEQDVNLVLTGNNIDLTDALREYVDKRIGGLLNKLGGGGIVRECDVHLSVYRNPKVRERQEEEEDNAKLWVTIFQPPPVDSGSS